MSEPYTVFDFEWVRGTTGPDLVFTFTKNTVPISFDDAVISVFNKGGKSLAWRASIQGNGDAVAQIVHDPSLGKITLTPTAQQTRMLTPTKADGIAQNRYEVELRNGPSEVVYVMGAILGTGGLNSDEADEVS
jgi:hypothetical protein